MPEKGWLTAALGKVPGGPMKRLVRSMSALNVCIYKASGGKRMGSLGGSPICLVTMRGRKSGQLKTVPLMYVPHGDDVLLVASLGGAPKHPLWYHNLIADPAIDLQVGRRVRRMQVREASAAEHEALWPVAVARYPSYADYQTKTARKIPILICSAAG